MVLQGGGGGGGGYHFIEFHFPMFIVVLFSVHLTCNHIQVRMATGQVGMLPVTWVRC